MNIKSLPLESWMKNLSSKSSPRLKEIKPILDRPGYFKYDNKVWFEVNGKAFEYNVKMFDYRMNLLNFPALNKDTEDLLRKSSYVVPGSKKTIEKMLRFSLENKDLSKSLSKMKLRLKKFKEARNIK